jgi:ParB family chromosome partitioning protein
MSVTESKAKTPAKTSKKAVKPAESAALKAALEAAQIEMVPLSALVKSPLNVRTIPYPPESVREMADSILAVGLIQNLVVHTLPDGLSGVAAGGRRLAALQLLQREQRIDAGHQVIVKRVSDELAVVASMVENNNRVAMHPAEQISGFRTLSEQGKTPAQIGDQLGYSSRHVQRMLKLASLAPELIALLAENTLDVEQCQALSLESDPARQVEIYQRVKAQHSYAPAHMLKRAITDTEISVRDARFMFVGREAYEAAGGEVREDLFSAQEGDGTADGVLVGRLVQEKLESAALAVEMQEGWSWSLAREGAVGNYGDDREHYLVLPEPEGELSADEQQRLDELYATQEATATYEDEAAIQVLIDEIEEAASIRAWTPEQKAACGVVVSLSDGELCIQRGVQKKVQAAVADGQESTVSGFHACGRQQYPGCGRGYQRAASEKNVVRENAGGAGGTGAAATESRGPDGLAAVQLRVPLLYHHPAPVRDESRGSPQQPDQRSPDRRKRSGMAVSDAGESPSGSLLPEGWKNDFTTFFALDGQTLMSLMASVPPVPWTASRPANTDIPAAVTSTVSRRRSGSICATGGSQQRITSSGYSARIRLWRR